MKKELNTTKRRYCNVYTDLYESFVFTKPVTFYLNDQSHEVTSWIELIDCLCQVLKKKNSELMNEFLEDETRRRRRVAYLSREEQGIRFAKYLEESDLFINEKIDAPRSVRLIYNLLKKFDETSFQLHVVETQMNTKQAA